MSQRPHLRIGDRTIWLVPSHHLEAWTAEVAAWRLHEAAAAWPTREDMLRLSEAMLGPTEDLDRAVAFLASRFEQRALWAVRLDDPLAGLRYRALAEGCAAGHWQVFCHHGAGYAVHDWPEIGSASNRALMFAGIFAFSDGVIPAFVDMPTTWAAFYWRCRWTGSADQSGAPVERLDFNLERCMR